ncbi:ABC transporter substrate-binding protein [Variovorax sp. KBW07]|uniref:ABC transporter substrate-binding protein n=1 Tax=Variovorax sp. KBW07 TaxID=2153358 RepID=UPI00162348FF|nr:ABC transporter substrate-binding protein [Variovorax sp. KBW07]
MTTRWLVLLALIFFGTTGRADEIVIGQSLPLSGPLGEAGRNVKEGVDAYLARVQREGILGRHKLSWRALDDGYSIERHVENIRRLVGQDRVDALGLSAGTSHIDAAYAAMREAGTPLIGAMTGASALHGTQRPLIYHLRASYADEVRQLVAQAVSVRQRRVFAVWQDDGLGRDAFAALEVALRGSGIELVGQQGVVLANMDGPAVATAVRSAAPDALFALCVTPCAVKLLSGLGRDGSHKLTPYMLSIVNGEALAKSVGNAARGTVISQVMPNPHLATTPLVQRYQQDMRSFTGKAEFSYFSLEGYVAAMVAVEAARTSLATSPRRPMQEAMRQLLRREVDGIPVSSGDDPGVRPHPVTLSMIGNGGKLIH